MIEGSKKTFTAGEALTAKKRVYISAANTVKLAGASERGIGVTEYGVASGAEVAVRLFNAGGTIEIEVAAAIAAGAQVWAAASGEVTGVEGGALIGIAVEAATADGDQIEVLPIEEDSPYRDMTWEVVSNNKTLDIQDVGKVMLVDTDAKTITLPAVATEFEFVIMNGGADGAVLVTVSPNANDKIMGADLAGVDDKDRLNTKATAKRGDFIHLVYANATGWNVIRERGTWAAEA